MAIQQILHDEGNYHASLVIYWEIIMKVVGIDPAPKKHATLFERSSGWSEIDAHLLPQVIDKWPNSNGLLLCWDAPLTVGGYGSGRYYERDIERFFHNHKDFMVPEGISVLPFAGCSHWAVTHATFGLPKTGKWSFPLADLPFALRETGGPPDQIGRFVVEVHPAVSLWLWCRERMPNGPWTYKTRKANRELIWKTFSNVIPHYLPEREPKNDDEIDSFVACLLGELWITQQNVVLLGCIGTGSFLVPDRDNIAAAFQHFVDSRQ